MACLVLAGEVPALAQDKTADATQSADQAQPTVSTDNSPTTLSPFVVDATTDEGYRATSTLAGSRINTNLKDVAASVTVVTKDFFDDVSAVDVNDILSYTANTEGTHDFTSTQSGSANGPPGIYADNPAGNPQQSIRIRGLTAPDVTRDYYYTIGGYLGFDTYNLDSVTIVRGPNSILSGLGSPSGIINYEPQIAGLEKDSAELSYRFGSWGDERFTLNTNLAAIPGKLAVRVAAEASDEGFKQQPSYDHDRRVYVTSTYQPFKKTTVRAAFELININNHLPNDLSPVDDITQWIALGKPTYNLLTGTPATFPGMDPGQNHNGANTPFGPNGALGLTVDNKFGDTFEQANLSNVGIWTPTTMSSNKYGDWEDLNTSPNYNFEKGSTETFSIDQEILPNLYLNLGYLHERVDLTQNYGFTNPLYQEYRVDVDQYLPNGQANPYFGDTYMFVGGENNLGVTHDINQVARATLTYQLDLNKYNKWLGRYSFTGFAEERQTESEYALYSARNIDAGPDYNLTSGASLTTSFYLGGNAANGYVAQKAPSFTPAIMNFTDVPYLDMVNGVGSTTTFSSAEFLNNDQNNLTDLKSEAAVVQGWLWQDKIAAMYGVRHDADGAAFASSSDATDPVTGLLLPVGGYPAKTTVSGNTNTYGFVVHPLKWLSFEYNHADNFIPNAGHIDLLGNATATPTGVGKDYGFTVSTPDDKLSLKVNWFSLVAANGDAGTNADHLAMWTITFMDLEFEPELAAQAGIPYKQAVAPGIAIGDPRLEYTANNVANGYETELTYNPTHNWRIMANFSKTYASQTDIAPALTAFIEQRLAYWQSIPALWTGQVSQASGNQWGLQQTGQQHWDTFDLAQYVAYQAANGQPSTQVSKYHANVLTNYKFTSGIARGFNVGGGLRYVEGSIIGEPAIYSVVNGAETVTGLDLAHPYTSDSYVAVDAWVGYAIRLKRGYLLSFQLNGRDLETGGGYRPIVANSDGTDAVFRIVEPRTFYLTTKLQF